MTRERSLLLGILLLTTLLGIFDHDLWAPDEPRAAELGREFLDGGSWAVPRLNGEPFLEKPPLVYWTIAMSLKIFGLHDWAARLPAVFFAWGTLVFTALLARRIYGPPAAESALLVLATSAGFLVATHHLESDAGLLFFVTATAYFLWRAIHESRHWYGAAALAALGAFFSKGPIGLVFPGLLFLAWILWTRTPGELLRARPWIWIPILALPIAAWMWRVRSEFPELLETSFVYENQVRRFLGTRGDLDRGHLKPLWFYFLQLPLWFMPWTLLLAGSLRWIRGRLKEPGVRFLLSWFGAGFLFLCAAGTKRAIYVVPILPPLAILAGERLATLPLGRRFLPAAAGVVLILGISWACVVPRLNERLSAKPFCLELSALLGPQTRLYGYDVDESARAFIPFYTGRRFVEVSTPDEIPETPPSRPEEIAVLTQDNRGKDWHSRVLSGRWVHLWLTMPEGRDHRMRVYSNVERR